MNLFVQDFLGTALEWISLFKIFLDAALDWISSFKIKPYIKFLLLNFSLGANLKIRYLLTYFNTKHSLFLW